MDVMFSGTVLKFVDQLGQGWHVSALTVETVWHKYFLPMQQKYLSPLVSVLTAQNSQKKFYRHLFYYQYQHSCFLRTVLSAILSDIVILVSRSDVFMI